MSLAMPVSEKKAKEKQRHRGGRNTSHSGWWMASHHRFRLSICETQGLKNTTRKLYHLGGGQLSLVPKALKSLSQLSLSDEGTHGELIQMIK